MAANLSSRLFGVVVGLSQERSVAYRVPTRVEAAVRRLGLSYVAHRNGELILQREADFDFTQSEEAVREKISDALSAVETPVAALLKVKYPRVRLR